MLRILSKASGNSQLGSATVGSMISLAFVRAAVDGLADADEGKLDTVGDEEGEADST